MSKENSQARFLFYEEHRQRTTFISSIVPKMPGAMMATTWPDARGSGPGIREVRSPSYCMLDPIFINGPAHGRGFGKREENVKGGNPKRLETLPKSQYLAKEPLNRRLAQ